MNNEYPKNLKQLINRWRSLRKHDWYDDKWIQDDESSLSTKEAKDMIKWGWHIPRTSKF